MESSFRQVHQWVSDLGPGALHAFDTHCRGGTSPTWLANWIKRSGGKASTEDVRAYRDWVQGLGYDPLPAKRGTATS